MRDFIISEIKRLAAQAGGQAPGNQAFVSATGIIEKQMAREVLGTMG
jgi:hypothetical protein